MRGGHDVEVAPRDVVVGFDVGDVAVEVGKRARGRCWIAALPTVAMWQ